MMPANLESSYWVTFTCCLLHLSKSQALLALSKALSNMTSPANCQKSALDFPDCCKLAVIWACYCTQWFDKSAVCILIIKYTGHFILNEYVTSCVYKHCSYYRGEVNSLLIKVWGTIFICIFSFFHGLPYMANQLWCRSSQGL